FLEDPLGHPLSGHPPFISKHNSARREGCVLRSLTSDVR
ncbi:hypothetical protein A2U01_0015407, partial [Trifolium medium]|nr:hypothetical protein [Trifolium medium]